MNLIFKNVVFYSHDYDFSSKSRANADGLNQR